MIIYIKAREIEVTLIKKSTSSYLRITVFPDFRITATAPDDVSNEEIKKRIQRRIPWIEKQLNFFEGFLPHEPERRYINGENLRYRGRQYRLKVEQDMELVAKLKGRFLVVKVPDVTNRKQIQSAVEVWYTNKSKILFDNILKVLHDKTSDVLKTPMPPLTIRKMTKRWGSFTPKGRLILNSELIRVPDDCIEYVIMHELCHSQEPNHSKKFERLLSRLMPDWKERRLRLDKER